MLGADGHSYESGRSSRALNQRVLGSSPSGSTNLPLIRRGFRIRSVPNQTQLLLGYAQGYARAFVWAALDQILSGIRTDAILAFHPMAYHVPRSMTHRTVGRFSLNPARFALVGREGLNPSRARQP